MKNISLRNILILVAATLGALLVLGLISTLLNQVVPITVALIVGVVLGRLSVDIDLVASLRSAIQREKPETKTEPATKPVEETAEKEIQAGVEAIKRRIADEPDETPEAVEATDFKIKTEEQILAEARQRETEIACQSNEYDPAAALEERRRRLLGDKADDS